MDRWTGIFCSRDGVPASAAGSPSITPFPSKPSRERAHRGQLARGGRTTGAVAEDGAEKQAHVVGREVGRPQRRPRALLRRGAGGEKLREVALVGPDGVSRHVAVEPQVLDEVADVLLERSVVSVRRIAGASYEHQSLQIRQRPLGDCPLAVGALGRAASDDVERRHDAEGDVARLVVLRLGMRHVVGQSAPMAVVRGNVVSGSPSTSAAALRPASSPEAADST